MEDKEKVFYAALAGLLHDVGKFAQRAGVLPPGGKDGTDQQDALSIRTALSRQFVAEYVPEEWRKHIQEAAGDPEQGIVAGYAGLDLADQLSAGGPADSLDKQAEIQPRHLLSIFCSVVSEGKKTATDSFLPLLPLELDRQTKSSSFFPGAAWDDQQVREAFKALRGEFCQQAATLRDAHQVKGNIAVYLESLQLLLQRYTWCIPSASYQGRADVSLYDHNRMKAALAAIFASPPVDGEMAPALEAGDNANQPLALLVGGDISGVQDFIYTISAKGATSALRGRSFYLQLLTEIIARYILQELNLPVTNLIYAGGGNFYLLARPSDANRLVEIQKEISCILLYHHQGDLYVALAALPLCKQDFFGKAISDAWGNLIDVLRQNKLRRFSELGDDLVFLFAPQGHGGNEEKQCQVCGNEHPDTKEDTHGRQAEDESGPRKCPPCFSYEDLGEKLRDAEYLILQRVEPAGLPQLSSEPDPGTWQTVLKCFGYEIFLPRAGEALTNPAGKLRSVLALSSAAMAGIGQALESQTAIGRRLLVNVTPKITGPEISKLRSEGVTDLPVAGSTKPFHALEAQADGIKRLGVLRMDVDNLGKLFSEGLGAHASLARIASLSFAVSLYFEGWVEVLAERQNELDRQAGLHARLYSIYSGGDDLFFVGSWDVIVELARQIRADLAGYAASHPGIHVSAGIALVGGKYPLYQAAQDSHAALEQAKHTDWYENGKEYRKDMISFLGQCLPWRKFGLEACTEMDIHSAHALMHLLIADKSSGANPVIRRLIGFHEKYQQALEERKSKGSDTNRAGQVQVLWGPWNWLSYYSLSRLYRQRKEQSIRDLRDQLKADDFHSIEWIGLAARWAELRRRQ